jgi:hypothetical protein
MNEHEALARMSAAVEQLARKYEMFKGGDSIVVLEEVLANPYGTTPNEDVGRLAVTLFAAVATQQLQINALLNNPNQFGIYPPVQKGKLA